MAYSKETQDRLDRFALHFVKRGGDILDKSIHYWHLADEIWPSGVFASGYFNEIKIDGPTTSGYVLTTDINGWGTWQAPTGGGGSGSGYSGYSGYSGQDGQTIPGESGYSGYSGGGDSGYSGYSGDSTSGYSGYSGDSTSGYSGYSAESGYSGYSSDSGYSGYSGYSSESGYSGYSGDSVSGYSGYSGDSVSGYSGYSGDSVSGYSGYSGDNGAEALSDLTDVNTTSPAPARDEVLKWNGSLWVPAVYNATFAMTISTFDDGESSPQLIGPAASAWETAGNIAFTASYSNPPPASASIAQTGSSAAWSNALTLLTPFTSGVSEYDTKYPSARDGTITFTLTAYDGATPRTSAVTVTFPNNIFYGVSTTASSFDEAAIEALTPAVSSAYTTSRALNAGASEYLVVAFPAAYTSLSLNGFLYQGVIVEMALDTSTLSIQNANLFSENYKVYVSTESNLGASTLQMSTSDTRINRFYYGGSTLGTGWTGSQIKALTDIENPITNDTTQTFNTVTLAASEYFVFAYPSRCTDPTNWYDNSTGFQLSLYSGSPETVAVENENGYTENYDVWRSNNVLGPGDFQLRTS